MNDLRLPTGILFAVLGSILLLYGLVNPEMQAPLEQGVAVNLWCGLTLLVFGVCLLWLSYRAKS